MRLYVIEGLDGSGKDTQALLLREYLSGKGHAVVLRVHPSADNVFGRVSKWSLMRRGRFWRFVATLFYGLDVVRSVILYCHGDRDVILVRYTLACAYLPGPLIKPVYAVVSFLLPKSPNMFFLDVSPEEALRRIHLRGDDREMFETLPQLRKNRERALSIAGYWNIIDGNKSPKQVFKQIVGFLSNQK